MSTLEHEQMLMIEQAVRKVLRSSPATSWEFVNAAVYEVAQ